MPIGAIPGAAGEVAREVGDEALAHLGWNEAPGGIGQPRAGVEQALRAAVIGLAEAVGAVERDRHRHDADLATEAFGDGVYRWIAPGLHGDRLGRVAGEPEQ